MASLLQEGAVGALLYYFAACQNEDEVGFLGG
jgi:hypothetical protein